MNTTYHPELYTVSPTVITNKPEIPDICNIKIFIFFKLLINIYMYFIRKWVWMWKLGEIITSNVQYLIDWFKFLPRNFKVCLIFEFLLK